jgi:hypothetical protein
MLLINFAHPLTDSQKTRIGELVGRPIERVLDVRTQFDPESTFAAQAKLLVEQLPISSEEWQTAPLLINPPSLSPIACLVLAELHGRMGYFPPILRWRPMPNSTPPSFEVAEILNLQEARERARLHR